MEKKPPARTLRRAGFFALAFLVLLAGLAAQAGASGSFWDSAFSSGASSARDDLPRFKSRSDNNGNGLSDTDDIIVGARAYVAKRPVYRNAYHRGGYPPEGEGVCTDVIWAALRQAGYDLKQAMTDDIRAHRHQYRRIDRPDSNIDFRRVPNLIVYFKRHGKALTTTIKPGDRENLSLWQPGDIVTFANPDHVAILSDRRNREGVPYLLHNQGPWAEESDDFMYWYKRGITGHFRFPPE